MDPNQSLDALVKQMHRKPQGGSAKRPQTQGKAAKVTVGGKTAGARRPAQVAGARAANARQAGRPAAKGRQGGQQQQQRQQQRQQQGQRPQQRTQQAPGNRGGGVAKQLAIKLNRRKPSAGILSRLGDNDSTPGTSARGKSRPQLQQRSAAPTSKNQLAKHVEQVVQQRRLKDMGNARVKLQRKQLNARQTQTLQSQPSQLRRPVQQSKTTSQGHGLGQLTVKVKNTKTKAQVLAARRSLARARSTVASSHSSGILASEPIIVDTPTRPLTIQVKNESARQPAAVLGGRPQPSATVDIDLYRDSQSIAILQTSIRQSIVTPAPIQGMGVDISRVAMSSMPGPTISLHARFAELPHPSQSASVNAVPVLGGATRGRTILG